MIFTFRTVMYSEKHITKVHENCFIIECSTLSYTCMHIVQFMNELHLGVVGDV